MTYHFDYSRIDVEDYLHELGLTNIQKKGDQVWFSCPLPGHAGADRTPSASMELDTTRMHCFGCGFSGNAVSFLAEYEGVSPLKARKWLRERFEMTFFEPEDTFLGEIEKKLSRQEKRRTGVKERARASYITLLDEAEIEKRHINWDHIWDLWQGRIDGAYPLAYMLDRGFHPHTLNTWAIGWDMISQRISIPIRDDMGNLIGFKARAVDDDPRRYLVLGGPEYGFDTYHVGKVLFGLNVALKHIITSGRMVVREGELNTIAMHQAGIDVAIGSGKMLSDTQVKLIKKYAWKEVIFSYDEFKDSVNAAKLIEMDIPCRVCPPSDRDPSDMTKNEILEYVDAAESTLLL